MPFTGRWVSDWAYRLHPAVLGERNTVELLAEILDHIVALELAVHQHVQADLFLERDGLGDLRLDEALVILGAQLMVVQLAPRRPHLVGLRERTDRRGRIPRQTHLRLPAHGVRLTAHAVRFHHRAGAALLLAATAARSPFASATTS